MTSCVSSLYWKKITTFVYRINKEITVFTFKHDLTWLYKDDFLSPSNRFLDSNSGFSREVAENVLIHQMFEISNILKIDNF